MQATMTPKQAILNAVQQLSEHTSIEDAMERLFVLAKVRKGCEEADSGKTVSHAEAEKRMEKWLDAYVEGKLGDGK